MFEDGKFNNIRPQSYKFHLSINLDLIDSKLPNEYFDKSILHQPCEVTINHAESNNESMACSIEIDDKD